MPSAPASPRAFSVGLWSLLLVLVLTMAASALIHPPRAHTPAVPPAPNVVTHQDRAGAVHAAIARGLPFLETDGVAWFEGRVPIQNGDPCVSCHQVTFALWSHAEASRAGLPSGPEIADLRHRTAEFLLRPFKGRPVSFGQFLLAREGDPSETDLVAWRSMAERLNDQQERDGYWRARGQFPSQRRPVRESDAVATMWTLLAVAEAAPWAEPISAGRKAAVEWLRNESGETIEWLAARLVVERELGDAPWAQTLGRELEEHQQGDGGWGWAPGDPSNAFSTGQAIYALARVGDESSAGAIERGVEYLLAAQGEDGTWSVPSELVTTEPSPGKDYVYRYWGTAWATIGLARSLERLRAASAS